MGLDMFLERMPRSEATPFQVGVVTALFDWEEERKNGCEYDFEEWCGYSRGNLPSENIVEFYRPFYSTHYYGFDVEKKYPHKSIVEEVAYWRKANHIHNWFVNRVQNGIDDCSYHEEVTEDVLLELLYNCRRVLESLSIAPTGELIGIDIAKEVLPTASGFFFGGTDYDEWYLESIKDTIEQIEKILEETDFKTQMVYYCSSW